MSSRQIFKEPVVGGVVERWTDSIVPFINIDRFTWDENRYLEKLGASWAYIKSVGWSSRTVFNDATGLHERRKLERIYTSVWPIVIREEWDDEKIIFYTLIMIDRFGQMVSKQSVLDVKTYTVPIDWSSCNYDN
jgi:hypothetical protein